MKTLIKIAIAVAIANAIFHVATAYLSYYQFKDSVEELAMHSGGTDAQMRDKVVELAAKYEEPVDPDAISIRREEHHTFIEMSYTKDVQLFPGYVRKWSFDVNVDAFILASQKVSGGRSPNP
jgi:hypothetical protein